MKRPIALIAAGPSIGTRAGWRRDVPHGLAERRRLGDHARERGLADAAPRAVRDAREADLVGRVGQQREIGDRVLDLRALVELRPADHLVGHLRAHQRVLEHARLRVGPVEDRDLRARDALVDQLLDRAQHGARLGVLVGERADRDRVALADLGPQLLAHLVAVVRDHRVGRREDRLRRAVVLLELDDVGVGEVVLEVEDVADVGAAEAVDRLRVVADDGEVAPLARQQRQPAVLRVVGVLVLVDQHVAEGLLVALAHLGEQLEHVDRAHQQVVEVHRVEAHQLALVELVGVGDRLLEVASRPCARYSAASRRRFFASEIVRLDRRRREALGVGADGVEAAA